MGGYLVMTLITFRSSVFAMNIKATTNTANLVVQLPECYFGPISSSRRPLIWSASSYCSALSFLSGSRHFCVVLIQ